MSTDITNNLPRVVADHLAACNAHDINAWMATFAPDAMLNDINREFIGAEAIRAFGDKSIAPGIAMATSQSTPRWTGLTIRPACPTR